MWSPGVLQCDLPQNSGDRKLIRQTKLLFNYIPVDSANSKLTELIVLNKCRTCVSLCVCASSSNGNSYYHQNSSPPPKLPPWKLRPKTLGFNNRVDQFVLLFVCVFDQYRPNRIYFWFAFRFLFSVTKPFHMTATLHDDTGTLCTRTHNSSSNYRPTATDGNCDRPTLSATIPPTTIGFHRDRLSPASTTQSLHLAFSGSQLDDLHRSTAQAIMKLLKEQMQTETETFERFHEKVGSFEIAIWHWFSI